MWQELIGQEFSVKALQQAAHDSKEALTEIQEIHLPQPFCSHCKVAAKSLAAVDLPLPGGPVNNQA